MLIDNAEIIVDGSRRRYWSGSEKSWHGRQLLVQESAVLMVRICCWKQLKRDLITIVRRKPSRCSPITVQLTRQKKPVKVESEILREQEKLKEKEIQLLQERVKELQAERDD